MSTLSKGILQTAQIGLLLAMAIGTASAQETAKPADSFVDSVGVNIKLRYLNTPYANFSMVEQMLQQAGIRHIRDGISPTLSGGTQQISEFNELAAAGIHSDLIFDTNSYTGSNPAQGVLNTIALVPGVMDYAEGPNEPDGDDFTFNGDSTWYRSTVDYQNMLWAAIKLNGSPYTSLPVIAPSMGNPLDSDDVEGMQYVSNYANTHSYQGARNPETTIVNLGMNNFYIPYALVETTALPIVATETGNWVGTQTDPTLWMPPITANSQGKYALRTFAENFNLGIVRTYMHELIDEQNDPNVAEENFGIIYNNWTPKPAYTGLKNINQVLADPNYSFTPGALKYTLGGSTANIDHMLLQKHDGSFYLVLWQAVESYNFTTLTDISVPTVPITVTFQSSMCQVDQTDPMTSPDPFATAGNVSSLTVNVADKPLILHIMPTAYLPDLVVTQTSYTGNAGSGGPLTFTATVENIGDAPTAVGVETGVGFYLENSNGALASGPLSWGEITNNAQLAPGASYNLTADFSATLAPGTYTIVAWADDVDRMAELNKNNNQLGQTIVVN